jgi:putative Holliday junction resolvase
MLNGRILALDYGAKNVGLACSDELHLTVQPLGSVPNRSYRDLIRILKQSIKHTAAVQIVVGKPLNMDGTAGDAVHKVEHFVEKLRNEISIPVTEVDERLSTIEALEIWNRMSDRQKRKYRTIDSLSAALILERYLQESNR